MFYRLSTPNHSWGTFENLDFEEATVPNPLSQVVPFGLALPGWIGYTGTQQVTNALYNGIFLDSAGFGLQTNSDYGNGVLNGRYFVSIEAGFSLVGEGRVSSYLSQTGMIPSDAQSMRFNASSSDIVVSVAGQTLKVIFLGGVQYGVNVAAFSGKTTELRFTVLPGPPPGAPVNGQFLDSIGFYPRPVP